MQKKGRFELADHGTLFLDEIGDISLELQPKLLRALQEQEFERLGSTKTIRVDVRLIAATHRDLPDMIRKNQFREDLFYRLNVFPVEVPALRQRVDDIPLLASHFVKLSTRELKCAKPRLTRAAVMKLQAYDWPGNVRELRNVVERAVILARGWVLEFDLPVNGQAPGARPSPRTDSSTLRSAPEDGSAGSVGQHKFLTEVEVQRFERDNLLLALQAANWKITGRDSAAELLGLKPTTLISRMAKWGLKKPEQEIC
jgi:transcriptional regulator with GAF, ATPase, and Fis domain